MGLALGVVVARTMMSLFDYISHQVNEEVRLFRAKREVFTPMHRREVSKDMLALEGVLIKDTRMRRFSHLARHQTPHEIAVAEAAEAARQAHAKALGSRHSAAQMEARRDMSKKLYLQILRTTIASVTSFVSISYVRTGHLPWPLGSSLTWMMNHGLAHDEKSLLPELETMAVFVPALVGGFELSHGLRDLLWVNQVYTEKVKLFVIQLAVRFLDPIFALSRAVLTLLAKFWRLVGSGLDAIDQRLLGSDTKRRLTLFFTENSAGKMAASVWRQVREIDLLFIRMGLAYNKATRTLQRHVQQCVKDTHYDGEFDLTSLHTIVIEPVHHNHNPEPTQTLPVWPWVFGLAGFQVQTGILKGRLLFLKVPLKIFQWTMLPVASIGKFSWRLANMALLGVPDLMFRTLVVQVTSVGRLAATVGRFAWRLAKGAVFFWRR